MKAYDVKCPNCKSENKDLYLDETEGSFICEKCGRMTTVPGFERARKIPVYSGAALAKAFAHKIS